MRNREERKETYRYERKYLIDNLQLENYSFRMGCLCSLDDHVGERGEYHIRSLYFDDLRQSHYNANEAGVDNRGKWRFRIYNGDDGWIRLEHKTKKKEKIHKDSVLVTREFCEKIMNGEQAGIAYPVEEPLINKFLFEYFANGLRPSIIVEYVRIPYVLPEGDVRITFDKTSHIQTI